MYVEHVPNRNSPPAVLFRSSHWDHGKIRKVTHANLSKLPQPLVDAIALLRQRDILPSSATSARLSAKAATASA